MISKYFELNRNKCQALLYPDQTASERTPRQNERRVRTNAGGVRFDADGVRLDAERDKSAAFNCNSTASHAHNLVRW